MKKPIVVLLHLIYWLVYAFVYAMFLLMVTKDLGLKLPNLTLGRTWLSCFFIPGTIAFYSCYTFLFSKFLTRKKILPLITYTTLMFLVSILIEEMFLFIYIMPNPGFVRMGLTSASGIAVLLLLIAFVNGIMGFILRGFVTWYGDIKLKEELNKKNYEMELALVKSQINPHFLFNTLNNIDIMIGKDPDQASAYLNKLSDIMRFMLYETKTEEIPLAKELIYIEKYIDLQKIRASNANYVNYIVTGSPDDLRIAPMLFIPFIENAFKHTENKNVENAITIKMNITKEKIAFNCENKINEDNINMPDEGGLGNELIQKRLMLLYPNRHVLKITIANKMYTVELTLLNNAN